jgi:hypothetical protein
MLRYEKGNNFYKFRQALADVAQRDYGNLGRLIEEEVYYVPEIAALMAPPGITLDADEQKALKLATMKEYATNAVKMEADHPKLF